MKRILPLIIASLLLLTACHPQASYNRLEGAMLGTTFRVIVQSEQPSEGIYKRILEIDAEMKGSMSIFDPHSRVSRLNQNLTDSVDHHIAYNLELANEISRLSEGAYDVTVYPLVKAWGFAATAREERPNLDSLLEFVGYEKVWIEEGRLHKQDPRVQLDFNSIAKGYTVDCICQMLEELGAENYLVDVGGEVRCRGKNSHGEAWRIGVERPEEGILYGSSTEARIALNEGALATSGNYRRFFINPDGAKVAHTIDPKTGESILTRLLSVSVVAESCARADALATMYLSMGDQRALALAQSDPEAKVLFILAPKQEGDPLEVWFSPAMEQMIL